MAKNPFKVGDRVYVYPIGWGTVNLASIDTCEIDFDGDDTKTGDWRVASFTEYDPIKGGLSHERPEEKKRPTVDTSKFYDPDDFNRNYCVNREVNRESPSDNSIWSPMQYMTIDAIGEKLQEHDRILKGVSGAIDELKKVKVDGKIKLSDIWPIRPAFKKRFVSGGTTNECVLSKDQSRYRSLIKDFMSDFDVVGFNAYDELYEAPNKDGSLSPGIPTGRVTLSIDLVRRK